jgi:HAD superfamily hydrolase (TIGR01490 family)
MTQAAFFDLDKTVIAKSSTLAFSRPFYEAGMLGRRALLRAGLGQAMYVLFGADHDQMEKAREAMQTLTTGWRREDVESLVEEALDETIAPLVYAEALFLIDDHLRRGRRVIIISASPEEIVRPLARYVGVDEIIATRSRVDAEGRYTGELERYAYGPGKAELVREMAEREGIDLDDSYAYSDSMTDLPLLETVGHPVVVNPDKELRRIAEERSWPILEFQRQVSLRTRLVRPGPMISGATIGLIVGGIVAFALLRRKKR